MAADEYSGGDDPGKSRAKRCFLYHHSGDKGAEKPPPARAVQISAPDIAAAATRIHKNFFAFIVVISFSLYTISITFPKRHKVSFHGIFFREYGPLHFNYMRFGTVCQVN